MIIKCCLPPPPTHAPTRFRDGGNHSGIYLSAASGFRALKAVAERESQGQQMLRSALAAIPSQAPLLDADEGRRHAGCFCLLCPVLSRTGSDGSGLSRARILWLVCSVALSSSARSLPSALGQHLGTGNLGAVVSSLSGQGADCPLSGSKVSNSFQ